MTYIKASNVSLQVYFIKKFEMTPTAANAITGLIYTISAVASPFLGMYGNLEKRHALFREP